MVQHETEQSGEACVQVEVLIGIVTTGARGRRHNCVAHPSNIGRLLALYQSHDSSINWSKQKIAEYVFLVSYYRSSLFSGQMSHHNLGAHPDNQITYNAKCDISHD